MSLRTKSRMPASTSDTAARLVSTSTVSSMSSERMVAFIGYSSVSHSQASADVPRTTKWYGAIWTADFDRIWANMRQCWIIPGMAGKGRGRRGRRRLPAALETGREALAGGAGGGLADRARNGDAVEQLLLGADLAQPFVVIGRERLSRR